MLVEVAKVVDALVEARLVVVALEIIPFDAKKLVEEALVTRDDVAKIFVTKMLLKRFVLEPRSKRLSTDGVKSPLIESVLDAAR
jgi:hypothetical protein